ncbi:MAG: radical SAM protein [Deltaproteobacteria bacterium]|nr:radical SAM protein [Deltaproteobacteria bacterium]MBW2019233.1 radical SAM protein [Deltaproteobacteria bacterium]MBW2074039.1 radical SAM protein [Deltaproteobacteria bacterium]
MRFKPFIIPVFIPNMGCPHRCVFCDQVSITGQKDGGLSPLQVRERISRFLDFKGGQRGPVEVAFYGGNFLGLPTSYRQPLLDEAQMFVEKGLVDSIRFSTRPDTVTHNTLKAIAPYSVQVVEVGAQSMDETVLSLSRRGHTAEDTGNAVKLLKGYGLRVGLQIMPGLPGDTTESILETGRRVAELRPDFVRIYPTVVVKDTVLEKWYHEGRFIPLSLTDAIKVTKRLYLLFKARGIWVIRMGLQVTESLLEPGAVIAGPFHPAFGHLVYSAVFFDFAARELEMQEMLSKRVTLKVHPHDMSKLKGFKNRNIMQLIQRFNLEELQVLPDPDVPQDMVTIVNNGYS